MVGGRGICAWLVAAVVALGATGCSGETDNGDGCLSASEVRQQIDQVAGGIEASQADVAAKQHEIAEIQKQACR